MGGCSGPPPEGDGQITFGDSPRGLRPSYRSGQSVFGELATFATSFPGPYPRSNHFPQQPPPFAAESDTSLHPKSEVPSRSRPISVAFLGANMGDRPPAAEALRVGACRAIPGDKGATSARDCWKFAQLRRCSDDKSPHRNPNRSFKTPDVPEPKPKAEVTGRRRPQPSGPGPAPGPRVVRTETPPSRRVTERHRPPASVAGIRSPAPRLGPGEASGVAWAPLAEPGLVQIRGPGRLPQSPSPERVNGATAR